MAIHKRTFAHLTIDQPRLKAALPNVFFAPGCNLYALGLSDGSDSFTFTVVVRKETDFPRLIGGEKVVETINKDRFREVTLHLDGTLELQSSRDMKIVRALIGRCGFTDLEYSGGGYGVDLLKWSREIMEAHEFTQFGGVQVDRYYIEPRLIGRYTAKSVDNRVAMEFLEEYGKKLSAVEFGWLDQGLKHVITAHSNGTLEVSCKDVDEFFDDESRRFLACGERF